MPGMDGLELLKTLRTSGNKIPFIMFTGKGREEVAMEALNRGANGYLQKGVDIESMYGTLAHAIKQEVETKRAEEALRESIEKFRDLFENMMDGLVVHKLIVDENGNPVDYILEKVNKAAEKILSWKREDIEGKRATEVYGGDTPFIERYAKVAQTGKSEYFVDYYPGFGRWYEITSFCPEKGYFANVFRDITDRKRADEKLARIVDGVNIPAFAINSEHKITHWNTAVESLTGVKREEVLGSDKQWIAFYAQKRPVMAELIVDEVPESEFQDWYGDKYKNSSLIEGAYEASDFFPALGEEGKWLLFTAAPLRYSEGKIIGAMETLQDITERKRAEETLRESEEKYRSLVEFNRRFHIFSRQGFQVSLRERKTPIPTWLANRQTHR
jgi:PAS domain S-box-containing protein